MGAAKEISTIPLVQEMFSWAPAASVSQDELRMPLLQDELLDPSVGENGMRLCSAIDLFQRHCLEM